MTDKTQQARAASIPDAVIEAAATTPAEAVAAVLNHHIQIERNQRCICGWRPDLSKGDTASGWSTSQQHRDHLGEMIVEAGFGGSYRG